MVCLDSCLVTLAVWTISDEDKNEYRNKSYNPRGGGCSVAKLVGALVAILNKSSGDSQKNWSAGNNTIPYFRKVLIAAACGRRGVALRVCKNLAHHIQTEFE
eukprot:2084210-Amphidinium_carterae.1